MRRIIETKAELQVKKEEGRFWRTMICLILLGLLVLSFSVLFGRAARPEQVISALFGHGDKQPQILRILTSIRLPRALASFMIGACLAVSGLVYQTTFNNKLVSPDILGVGAGCCVGAGIAILVGLSPVMIRILAFAFGFASVMIAILLPKLFRNRSALALVLSGIIVGSLMDSVLALIKYIADKKEVLADIIFWIMGSVVGIQLNEVLISTVICLIPFTILVLMRQRINVVSLGPEEAESLGIKYKQNRLIIIACATLLTANCVSISGNIGWVGLVIPHIARALVGDDVKMSMPIAAICGGLFLTFVDTLSRLVSVNEIPLSIVTGFIGAIIYTFVLIRKGRNLND